MEHEILLDVRHLTHIFPLSRKTAVKAVDDVSFQIRRGEIFGLVGESGSGKSTAARCVMNIYQPYAGQIYYKGIDTCDRGQFRKLHLHGFPNDEKQHCPQSAHQKHAAAGLQKSN